jgi:hypothetical protein
LLQAYGEDSVFALFWMKHRLKMKALTTITIRIVIATKMSERYPKGEITSEQYNKMKKELETQRQGNTGNYNRSLFWVKRRTNYLLG